MFPKYVNSYKTEDKEYKDYSETRKTPEEIRAEIDDSVSSLLAKITTPQKTVSVIEIPGSQKKSIQDQLTRLGITEGFIYPEIEHRSNAILNSL